MVVSAMLFRGATARVFLAWRTGAFRPLVSGPILLEYARVLAYPKLRLPAGEIRSLLETAFLPFAETVEAKSRPRVAREDPADDEFLACARTGKADFLVSGDGHLLALRSYGSIPIVAPAAFLAALEPRPGSRA